ERPKAHGLGREAPLGALGGGTEAPVGKAGEIAAGVVGGASVAAAGGGLDGQAQRLLEQLAARIAREIAVDERARPRRIVLAAQRAGGAIDEGRFVGRQRRAPVPRGRRRLRRGNRRRRDG